MMDCGSDYEKQWLPIIALEGPSGIGKTTLLRATAERLTRAAIPVEMASNNDSGRWHPVIRDLAAHPDRALTLALATAAARAELREGARRPLLCDRYVLSTLVYQRFAGLPIDYLYSINRPLLSASVTIVLRLGADELTERRRGRPRKSDFFKDRLDINREIELYDEGSALLEQNGHHVSVVDASADENTIADRLSAELTSSLAKFRLA
ncbi:dTMP kinase [Bradyrhizobium acaciae]|uniref:dTMP kinase n=1 Tax=Bradyrhizobium acaciae TaxID=2683706 RepID=UPI001E4B8DFE|nr:AAA family ATPase [Bradyrhizobium acaciae]MCC8978563.1 AAA family ATPase [Bradyrhizobium acaciae]